MNFVLYDRSHDRATFKIKTGEGRSFKMSMQYARVLSNEPLCNT